MEFFRRSERGGRFALSQHSPVDQYEADSQLSRRTTPSTETEKSAAPSRKRVPVAVSPCFETYLAPADVHPSVRDVANARSNAAETKEAPV